MAFPEDDISQIITHVYRGERPNAYLASFVPFLSENISEKEIEDFVVGEFIRFFRFNVSAYPTAHSLPVHFTGSVAHHSPISSVRLPLHSDIRLGIS